MFDDVRVCTADHQDPENETRAGYQCRNAFADLYWGISLDSVWITHSGHDCDRCKYNVLHHRRDRACPLFYLPIVEWTSHDKS